MFHRMCHVSTVAAPSSGYSPNTPSLPDANMVESPALPAPAQCPPSFAHTPQHPCIPGKDYVTSEQESFQPVFNGSTSAPYSSGLFPSDSQYSSDPAFDTQCPNGTYDTTNTRGFSLYNASSSSPVLGLNDSLEEMESTPSNGQSQHNMFSEDPWLAPASSHEILGTNPTFFQAIQPRPEQEWKSWSERMQPLPALNDKSHDISIHNPSTNTMQDSLPRNPLATANFSFNPSFASGQSEECLNDHSTASSRYTNLPTSVSRSWDIGFENPYSSVVGGIPGLHQGDSDRGSSNMVGRNRMVPSRPSGSPSVNQLHVPQSKAANQCVVASRPGTSIFNVGHLVPRSTKAISSSVVRKPRRTIPSTEQKPVKALDLGLEGEKERSVRLQSNDRVIAPTPSASLGQLEETVRGMEVEGISNSVPERREIVRSKYFPSSAGCSIPPKSGSSRVISSSRVSTGATKFSDKATSGFGWGETSSTNGKGASGFDWGGALSTYLTGNVNNSTFGSSSRAALGSNWGRGSAINHAAQVDDPHKQETTSSLPAWHISAT